MESRVSMIRRGVALVLIGIAGCGGDPAGPSRPVPVFAVDVSVAQELGCRLTWKASANRAGPMISYKVVLRSSPTAAPLQTKTGQFQGSTSLAWGVVNVGRNGALLEWDLSSDTYQKAESYPLSPC